MSMEGEVWHVFVPIFDLLTSKDDVDGAGVDEGFDASGATGPDDILGTADIYAFREVPF